jgi:PleD family two-component response regulator
VPVISGSGVASDYDASSLAPFGCEVPVVWSFVYLALGRILELVMLCCRSAEAKEIGHPRRRGDLCVLAPGGCGRMTSKGRVLVVDDEHSIRRAVGRALTARGYDVQLATDGEEALSAAAAFQPDLVVLDLNLPALDGLSVCRQLRVWSRVPILVLSVREDEADKVAALDLGADDYLTKPFGIDELLARVRALLRRAGRRGHPNRSASAPTNWRSTSTPAA